MPDPLKTRISLLQEAEARAIATGRELKPEVQKELASYRAQGLAKGTNAAPKSTEDQAKVASFLTRALGSNREYGEAGEGARGLVRDTLHNVVPGIENTTLNSDSRQRADQSIQEFTNAVLRRDSGAAVTDPEAQRTIATYFPVPGDKEGNIQQKATARLRFIEGLKLGAGPLAEDAIKAADIGSKPVQREDATIPTRSTDISTIRGDAPLDAGGSPVISTAAHPTSTDTDKKFTALAQAAFNRGASREEIQQLASQYGYGQYDASLDKAINYRDKGGKGAVLSAPKSGTTEPTAYQRAVTPIASSPVGGGAIGIANGLTLGGLDEVGGAINSLATGKPMAESIAELDLQKNLARDQNPWPYFAGDVAGTVAPALLSGGLGAGGRAVGALAPRALFADAALGATQGALENNDNRSGGAVTGALSSAAGGVLGRGLVNRVAGAISPNVNPDVAFLRENGVRVTPGQALGETASRLEEKAISIPGTGDLIRNGRTRAVDDFNRAYVDDTLSHIGAKLPDDASGTSAMRFAQQKFNDAYGSARAAMQLRVDPKLVNDLSALDTRLSNGEVADDVYQRLQKIYKRQVQRRIQGGSAGGDDYKTMMSSLGKMEDAARRSQNFELSDALGDLKGVLDSAARRSSTPEAAAAMDAADAGYAKFVRAEKAAAMRGGGTGKFTPNGLDSVVQRMDSTVRSKAYLRGDALGQKWAEAGKNILRDEVPNSGTMDRLAVGGLAAGAGYLSPVSVGTLGALSTAYLPGVRDVATKIIAGDRGKTAKTIANAARDRAYLGTVFGSPLALAYSDTP